MTIFQLMIGIIAAAMLGVLGDRLLEKFLEIQSLFSHLIALVIAILILAYVAATIPSTKKGKDRAFV